MPAESPEPAPVTDEQFGATTPRQWWVYFELEEPLTATELAERSGLVDSSIRGHLSRMLRNGVVSRLPTVSGREPRYQRAVTLTPDQQRTALRRIGSSNLSSPSLNAPARASTPVPTGRPEGPSGGRGQRGLAILLGVTVALVVGAIVAGFASGGSSGGPSDGGAIPSSTPWSYSPEPQEPTKPPESHAPKQHKPNRARTTPALTDEDIADQALLLQVQTGDYPYFSGVLDSQLTNLGRALCQDLRDGYDPYSLAFQLADGLPETDEVEAAAFVGAAMGAYCPRYRNRW